MPVTMAAPVNSAVQHLLDWVAEQHSDGRPKALSAAPSARRMRKRGFSQRELNNLAVLAEKHPGLIIQRVAPDGGKIVIAVGKEMADIGNGATDNPWDSVFDADQKRAS
jgi:hypothetical protein